jgi:hypothetical protein
VTDLYFYANGTAEVYYDNEDEYDDVDWKLNGATLTLTFTYYTDTFVANYDGSAIRAAHSYLIKNDNTPHTENCVFSLGS